MTNNIARYEKLKAKRPSIVRASALGFAYWLVCGLLSFVFLVVGLAMFINAEADNWLVSALTGHAVSNLDGIYQRISFIVAGTCILLSILLFIIARLSKKIIRRTNYIISLEEVMDGELNPEPNYVEV